MSFWDDVGGFFDDVGTSIGHGLSNAAGAVGSAFNDVTKTIGNNPLLADALPMLAVMTPNGRQALANGLIAGGSGFLTGGPVGAVMGAGLQGIGSQMNPRMNRPVTFGNALRTGIQGGLAGKASPLLNAIQASRMLLPQPMPVQSPMVNALRQRAVPQAPKMGSFNGMNVPAQLLPQIQSLGNLRDQMLRLQEISPSGWQSYLPSNLANNNLVLHSQDALKNILTQYAVPQDPQKAQQVASLRRTLSSLQNPTVKTANVDPNLASSIKNVQDQIGNLLYV